MLPLPLSTSRSTLPRPALRLLALDLPALPDSAQPGSGFPLQLLPLPVKGTGHSKVDNLIALQMRASFFNRNDGIIYIKETYQGLRTIGVSVPVAIAGSLFINGALSPLTRPPRTISSPCLPIYIENISMGKHDSDTDAYDSEGRFVPEKFEQIFTNYAKTNQNVLMPQELEDMLQVNQDPGDTKRHNGTKSEEKLLYNLAKDEDGFLQEDTVRSVYDGSLFYKLEQTIISSKKIEVNRCGPSVIRK